MLCIPQSLLHRGTVLRPVQSHVSFVGSQVSHCHNAGTLGSAACTLGSAACSGISSWLIGISHRCGCLIRVALVASTILCRSFASGDDLSCPVKPLMAVPPMSIHVHVKCHWFSRQSYYLWSTTTLIRELHNPSSPMPILSHDCLNSLQEQPSAFMRRLHTTLSTSTAFQLLCLLSTRAASGCWQAWLRGPW